MFTSSTIVLLAISLALSFRLRKFCTVNNIPEWRRIFNITFFASIFLFAAEAIFQALNLTRWIWDSLLVFLVVFALNKKELKPLRQFTWAFIPYIAGVIISHLAELLAKNFFNQYENYFKNARGLAVIWLVAILYSDRRQSRAQEKERIKRQHEDELNRAIAIRKVELEGLVAERTAQLTSQKEELQHTLSELRSTQTQLIHSEKMASLGELTAGIAHEIQNPLNFVNNFSEVSSELLADMKAELLNGNKDEAVSLANDVEQNLQKILHHGKRADAIVKGMLQHSRASTGKKELTDINALADEYLRLAYHGLRAKDKSFNATIQTDFDEKLPKVEVVPQDIGRVMLNLLTNAFYAVTEKKKKLAQAIEEKKVGGEVAYEPKVTITTRQTGNKVEISVRDNGNGIPEESIDKIFQPFFTTKPTGQGTGLGLSMAYEIITKGHQGAINVTTKTGEGTTFTVQLPLQSH